MPDDYVPGLDPLPGGEVPRPAENPDNPIRKESELAPAIPVGSEARCQSCGGNGKECAPFGWFHTPCPDCQGTGQERVIPERVLRAWIKANRPHPSHLDHYDIAQTALLNDLSAWLDEHTAKAPTEGSDA